MSYCLYLCVLCIILIKHFTAGKMEEEEELTIWDEEEEEFLIELSGLDVHKSIVSRDFSHLEELIKARSSLEVKNNFGLTPLHVAVHRKDFKAVEALIKYILHFLFL